MSDNVTSTDSKTLLKNAYLELKRTRQELDTLRQAQTEPIAVIGMSCRFPGKADTSEAFWHILHDGIDAIRDVPPDRWDIEAYYDPNPETSGKMYTRQGGFLDHVDQFDPLFFGISPREAASMDPQQRLLLEVAWEALEHAGQAPDRLAESRTGVFVGIGQNDYAQLHFNAGDPSLISAYDGTGNGLCFASGRLSYILGLQGPNMAIDTACSSSLVAIHLACQSLRSKECDIALVGGVQLILTPGIFIFLSRARVLAPDGRCKTFAASADGFGRGEGCGILVLKRLSDALAHHDHILALIRGSAVNHDGPSGGLTVPNARAQQALLRQALDNARVEPPHVSYIETHGTGTALGDPIEVRALGAVMCEGRPSDAPLMIGSVKTNIGHLEAAAGVAGLIKIILALQHQEIPPHLHFSQPSPHIDWDRLPVIVPTRPTPWEPRGKSRIAGISSFGIAGTNAHVILEEAPVQKAEGRKQKAESATERPLHILTLSAKTEEALKDAAQRHEQYFVQNPGLVPGDVCFTANAGRAHFAHRAAIIAASTSEFQKKLSTLATSQEVAGTVKGITQEQSQPKIAFLFTGQGSQYVGMGRELYDTYPTFRQTLNQCDEILRPYLETPLLDVLYPSISNQQSFNPSLDRRQSINQTAYTQPALFAIEYALATMWQSWGIAPTAMLGHSIGEYVAACIAGVFSLEDGLKLVAERGRLIQALPEDGDMLAVLADEASVLEVMRPYSDVVSLAAVNGPRSVVVSGKRDAIASLAGELAANGIKTKALTVSHAFHSPAMEPILGDFESVAQTVDFVDPRCTLISDMTGQPVTSDVKTPAYWCRHIRQPVRFMTGMETLLKQGYDIFLEIGPKPILSGLGRQCIPKTGSSKLEARKLEPDPPVSSFQFPVSSFQFLPSLRQGRSDWQQLLESLGTLYGRGVAGDWEGFDRDYTRNRIPLPTYPFQRSRYWVEPVTPHVSRFTPHVSRPYLFALSASSDEALRVAARRYVSFIETSPDRSLLDICLEAAQEPKQHEYRVAVISESREQLQEQLYNFVEGNEAIGLVSGQMPSQKPPDAEQAPIVFLFSAFGSHYPEMGDALYKGHPVFRQAVDQCANIVRSDFEEPLLDILRTPDLEHRPLPQVAAAISTIEYALVELWKYWGIEPAVVMGSSLGEIPAARAAGVLNLEDSLNMAISIARLFQPQLGNGKTAAILADEAIVEKIVAPYGKEISIIVYGGLQNLISGHPQAIQTATADFEARGIEVKRLDAIYGFHSPLVESILGDFRQIAKGYAYSPPHIPIISCVEGERVTTEIATPDHWCEHLRQPVRFSKSVNTLYQSGYATFIEIGPRASLLGMAKSIIDTQQSTVFQPVSGQASIRQSSIHWLPSLRRSVPDWQQMLQSLARLYVLGAPINWANLNQELRLRQQTAPVVVQQEQVSEAVQSPLIQYLQQGDTEKLSQVILDAGILSENERQFLPKLVQLLVNQHKQHLTAASVKNLLYRIEWQFKEHTQTALAQESGTWLIFADSANGACSAQTPLSFGQTLSGHFHEHGHTALLIYPGETYALLSPNTWQIDPTQPQDVARLLHEVEQAHSAPLSGIIHAWSLDAAPPGELTPSSLTQAQRLGCGSLLHIVQALATWQTSARLWGVTRDAVPIDSSLQAVAQAPLWGLGRVIALEQPQIWGGLCDLAPDVGNDEVATRRAAEQVFTEITQPQGEDHIAFRQGERYVARLVPKALPEVQPLPLQPESTYLITGGLGALGLRLAQWMIAQGVRHLVLLGRRGASAQVQPVLEQMEQTGANVTVMQADVADIEAMEQVFQTIQDTMPPLRGIVHTAGVLDDKTLLQQNWESFAHVMAPKVQGTWNLHILSQSLDLDFLVLFSSAASLTGSPGQANYAAANAFMDAIAHYRKHLGLPALSINWGPWAGLGMAATLDQQNQARWKVSGINPLTPEQGLQAFARLCGASSGGQFGLPQIGVLHIDRERFQQQFGTGRQLPLLSEVIRTPVTLAKVPVQQPQLQQALLQRLQAALPEDLHPLVITHLQEQAATVLGLNPSAVDPQQSLNSMGFDSLMAIDLKNRLQNDLRIEIPMSKFIEDPTVSNLATQILGQLANEGILTIASLPMAEGAQPESPQEQAAQTPDSYPLSYAQQALWFLYQNMPESSSYNIAFPVRVRSSVDVAMLQKVFQALILRHPALRTTFTMLDGQPVQQVHASQELDFEHIDAAALSQDELRNRVIEAYKRPFNLKKGPLMRVHLFTQTEAEQAPEDHVLLLVIHHIVHDGWSLTVLLDEFRNLYSAELSGSQMSLPSLQVAFADFVQWQTDMLAGAEGEQLWDYWRQRLSGQLPVLDLPTDHPRPPLQTDHGASFSFLLTEELTEQLRTLAQEKEVTLYTLLLGAFQVLLHRYTGQTDILVGTPTTGRSNQLEFARVIGYFVNMIVLRADLSGAPTFATFLNRVHETVRGALAHQDYPFPLLVERLHPDRDPSRTPLFQVSFGLRRLQRMQELSMLMTPIDPGIRVKWGKLELEYFDLPQEEGQFDLVLDMIDGSDACSGIFKYNTDLFEQATIARMVEHFTMLLESIAADPEQPISIIDILSPSEKHQILVEWNETTTTLQHCCIHDLFEAQVAQTPDAIAVEFGQQHYTYRELNAKANQLAHYLQSLGLGPEGLVGLCAERSMEAIVGILGTLKAGGAYVPLDPEYPRERLAFMLEDAAIPILLTQNHLLSHLPSHQGRTICLDRDWDIIAQQGQKNPERETTVENLAYVIYTSGSTGQPKGVMVTHRGIQNLCNVQIKAFDVHADSRVLQFASLSFDASVSEIFVTFLAGASLCLASKNELLPGSTLTRTLNEHAITIVTLPPSALAVMNPAALPDLRTVVSAGEACSAEIIKQWSSGRRFLNAYGPTENTVCATINDYVTPEHSLSIGKMIANTQIYILDERLQPVPIGVPGELCLAGIGLARGYLNRPELTEQKFVPNPFGSGRLYRTGDLARYLPDGNIEFLGRIDHQVKVRGFRIELGEIENLLAQHPAVNECVVLAREDAPGEQRLVAYLLFQTELAHPASELRGFLKQHLPDYMIPAAFVSLEAFPLTPNGKIDRQALPAPEISERGLAEHYVAPQTDTEQQLADIWADVLKVKQVGIHDNFFDLGGDSILSLQIIARANQAGLQLSPNQIFQYQTIAELATVAGTDEAIQAEQGLVTGPVLLTPIQHWFFEQSLSEPHHWNQAIMLETRQVLDASLLQKAIKHLLEHHDALRLRFYQENGQWRQECIEREEQTVLLWANFSDRPESEQHALSIPQAAEAFQTSLNLSEGPLMRVVYFDFGNKKPGRLLLIIHHLAVDGVSWRILLEDLQTAYHQLSQGDPVQLPPKTTSFKTWAARLAEYSQTEALTEEFEYWLNIAGKKEIPFVPPLLKRKKRLKRNTTASAEQMSTILSVEKTHTLLHDVPQAYNTQINDVLLTALVQAFSQWMGESSLLIDLEGHGRENLFEDVDISRTVGWLTSVFPVLLAPGNLEQPGEALKAVKEHLRCIPNRGIGYGLLRYLNRKTSKKLQAIPQAEVSFNYLGQLDQGLADSPLFGLAKESTGPLRSPKDRHSHLLEINSYIVEESLHIEWTYSRNIHKKTAIETLANHFMDALQALIAHCQSPEAGGYTPSDFTDVELSQEQLDQVLGEIEFDE